MSSIPWIEAYRPNNFDNVVLDPYNKQILKNIECASVQIFLFDDFQKIDFIDLYISKVVFDN